MLQVIITADATTLAELIRTRQVSPVEVMQAHLDRIATVNPEINAIVTVAAGALDAAKVAEATVLAGDALGPLHGVPFTVKDPSTTPACRPSVGRRSSAAASLTKTRPAWRA